MSAKQFEKDVRRKIRKAFGMTVVATKQEFIEAEGRRALRDVEYAHLHQVFPQAPHTHSFGMTDPAKRFDDLFLGVTVGPFWHCPYCGADHERTVKLCDCCGARRRREYVH